MHIDSCMTGRAIFVDAACLDEDRPMTELRKAAYRALLEGAEPSEYVVIDEIMFYDPNGLGQTICHCNRRATHLPQDESGDVYLCCALWCPECGVLPAVKDGRELAACLPPPTIEQAEFLRGCRDDLLVLAARADELFPPEYTPADTLRAVAKKIDIVR